VPNVRQDEGTAHANPHRRGTSSNRGFWFQLTADEKQGGEGAKGQWGTGNPQAFNRYSYALNNPVRYTDPRGHCPVCLLPEVLVLLVGYVAIATLISCTSNAACVDAVAYPYKRWQAGAIAAREFVAQGSASIQRTRSSAVPDKARKTLGYIDKTGSPPRDDKGGSNYEHEGRSNSAIFPQTESDGHPITYKEYDVDPKPAKGAPEDSNTERLVLGSAGSAYYTNDHYGSFQRLR